jgi:RecA/RadA recombinase
MSEETTNIEKSILTKKIEKPKLYFNSGCDLLDIQAGGGIGLGHRIGKFINIVGDKSSGKTLLACETLAATYHNPKYKNILKWVYDDCEYGFSFDTKKLYNMEFIPKDKSKRINSHTVEELYCNIRTFLESIKENEFGIYVVDSLDALASEEDDARADERFNAFKKGKVFDKKSYGMEKAKYLSKEFFKQLAGMVDKKNVLLIIISQVRMNIDPMSFEEYTRAGGKAMDFFAFNVFWVANVNKILNKGVPVGITIKIKNTKGKTPRPYRITFVKMLFDYGVENVQSNIDYLYDLLTPQGKLKGKDEGSLIEWDNSGKLNRKKMIDYIMKNNLQKELRKRVIDKWEAFENSIRSNLPPKYSE